VLPREGNIFISVADRHKSAIVDLARPLVDMGFTLLSTSGTAAALEAAGIPVQRVRKLQEGPPNLLDYFVDRAVALVINTPSGKGARTDEGKIRAAAVQAGVPCVTTLEAATAAVKAIEALRAEDMQVQSLQERFAAPR
jgi:carbamoyl-phosphate synthase large subunit